MGCRARRAEWTPWVGAMLAACLAGSAGTVHADDRPAPDTGSRSLDVPKVPSFEMLVPSANAMGARQLRVMGRRAHQGKPVVVRGYVTHVYDCVSENLEPFKTRAQVVKELAADPKRCELEKIYLGDTKTTPREFSLHIADLPKTVAWKVGDYLEVAGTFAFTSPGGDKSRAGLVTMSSAKIVKPETGTKTQLPAPLSIKALPTPRPVRPSSPPGEKMRAIAAVMQSARKHAEWLSWADAQNEYRRVVATWDGHDVAWYELGRVYAIPGMFSEATDAFEKAFSFVPTHPVYAFEYGRSLWLRDYQRARQAEAKRRGIHEEYLELSAAEAGLKSERAQQVLEYALSLAPEQWGAHVALGDIYTANEDHRLAAEVWTQAIARGPKDYAPYFRLASLYREWGYEDEALAVAQAWMKVVTPDDTSDRMYVIAAQAYEAKGDRKKAIEMLSVVVSRPSRGVDDANLMRARLYVATKQYDKARADLDKFPTHNKSRMREVNVILSSIPVGKKKR
ncbi:MAG: tetratricopeptide repeat protein [Kofleriaceae bacterium]